MKMKKIVAIIAVAVASATAFLAVAGERDEQNAKLVAFGDIPTAAQLTITTNAAGNAVSQVGMATRHGGTYYIAKVTGADGIKNTIIVAADGSLEELRTQVAWNALPTPVQSTITAKANGGTVDLVELESKHGQLIYEVNLTGSDGTKIEIHVAQDGSIHHRHE
jgi:hypothetical protein